MNTEVRQYRPPRIFAIILLLLALPYLYGGIKLIAVGGSYYYALAGLAIGACAVLLWQGSRLGSRLYGLLLLATLLWGLVEVGADPWALMPRLLMLALIGLWFLTPFVRRGLYSPQSPPPLFDSALSKGAGAATLVALLGIWVLGVRNDVHAMPERIGASVAGMSAPQDSAVGEWRSYGSTDRGTRYTRVDQITPNNVGRLQKIWHVRTQQPGWFKVTPIQIGDLLYMCTSFNVVQALDAETGERRWEFDIRARRAREVSLRTAAA